MTNRVTEGALVSRVSRLHRSALARACTPLTKSEEKERLLAVQKTTHLTYASVRW